MKHYLVKIKNKEFHVAIPRIQLELLYWLQDNGALNEDCAFLPWENEIQEYKTILQLEKERK